jgi:hypothetical protein
MAEKVQIIEVNLQNLAETGIFCIKDKKSKGYKSKIEWYRKQFENGLRIKIAVDESGKQLGFIEFVPAEFAWRPIKAENYLFIQCIMVYSNENRHKGIAGLLIEECEESAINSGKSGVCTITSSGPWMADKSLFAKVGFVPGGNKDRFEIMYKSYNPEADMPEFIDWTENLSMYSGWNLVYTDQCPWHDKSANDLYDTAVKNGVELKIHKFTTPIEAQYGPSGFGTFCLIKDGEVLEDHYLSKTRFQNILNKILK